jgi:Ca2+-binding RTX toxin-like protein
MRSTSDNMFEALENRRMFSGAFLSPAGQLFIAGTDGADQITVSDTFVQTNSTVHERFLMVSLKVSGSTVTTNNLFRAADVRSMLINALGGDDVITLNTVNAATVYGGYGNDRITGGSGNDALFGDAWLSSEAGVLYGSGNDVIFGGAGNDEIHGNDGDDELHGGDGNDRIFGDAGFDKHYGENGDDFINSQDGVGNETVDGGAGTDTAIIDDTYKMITSGLLAGASIRVLDNVTGVELNGLQFG